MLRDGPIETLWSSELAYVVGLIATDGNLSSDGRHMNITSKDKEIAVYVRNVLGIRNKLGMKSRGGSTEKLYYFLQFGSVAFYSFLVSLGLTPAKSKTMGQLKIPKKYFPAFLRGCIDGDGCVNEFHHPESKQMQLRVSLCSASPVFLAWIHEMVRSVLKIEGGWIHGQKDKSTKQLSYGKSDSIRLLRAIYKDKGACFLARKYKTARIYLGE